MSEDLFDTIISNNTSERPAFRQAPEGDYLVTVREAKIITAGTGTKGIEMTFTIQENLNGADLEGVELSKCRLRDTQYVTDKTAEYVVERLGRINPETVGQTIRDSLDLLPGSEVVVKIKHVTHNRQGEELRTPWLEVSGYYSKAWYFDNKMAA